MSLNSTPPPILPHGPAPIPVPFSKLKILPEVQTRVALDLEALDEYGDSLAKGDNLREIKAVADGDEFIVADGFHRVNAGRERTPNGTINTLVYQPYDGLTPVQTAIAISCKSNLIHGVRRKKGTKYERFRCILRCPATRKNRIDLSVKN